MTRTLDGFALDIPPVNSQIIALAQMHRKQLDEAIYHQEIHLGDFNLAQRKRVSDYTQELDPKQRAEFYKVYNSELKRLSVDESPHLDHSETTVNVYVIWAVLLVIAIVLYFVFARNLIG